MWRIFDDENYLIFFFSTIRICIKSKDFSMSIMFSSNQNEIRREKNEIYSKDANRKSRISRWVFRRARICYCFFSRRLKFESSQKIFRWVLCFHQFKTRLDIKELKYILKMQDKNRASRVESLIESIFF